MAGRRIICSVLLIILLEIYELNTSQNFIVSGPRTVTLLHQTKILKLRPITQLSCNLKNCESNVVDFK